MRNERWLDRRFAMPRLAGDIFRRDAPPRVPSTTHRLAAGDRVRLVAWGGPTLNDSLPVNAEGNLGLPGVGVVPVGGRTVAEAQDLVVARLRGEFRDAGAVLAVEQAVPQGVLVTGEVERPGFVPVPPGGTLLDAVAAAGGVLTNGSLRAIRISRDGAADQVVDLYHVALEGAGGTLEQLPAGTRVHVPLAGPQVMVVGAVRRQATVELLPKETLKDGLAYAGGFAPGAETDRVRLLRETAAGQSLSSEAVDALAAMAPVDGDRVAVDLRRSLEAGNTTIHVDGAVARPATLPWHEGMTVGDAVALAGGAVPGADFAKAAIQRLREHPVPIDLGGGVMGESFRDLRPVRDLSEPVEGGDRLTVPMAAGPEQQLGSVSVQGQVVKPGRFPLAPGLTAGDALRLSGGVTDLASLDAADLVRLVIQNDGSHTVALERLDLRTLIAGQRGPELRNRDTIVVRSRFDERIRVRVSGQVRNDGEFVLPMGTTLRQAIDISGGLTAQAFAPGMRLFRPSEAEEVDHQLQDMKRRVETSASINRKQLTTVAEPQYREVLEQTIAQEDAQAVRLAKAQATGRMAGIDLAAIISGDAADLPLQDGDRIEIPARPGTVRVLGEVMVPGSLVLRESLMVTEAIRRSGGPTQQADRRRIFVVRADGSVVASAGFQGTYWDRGRRQWVRASLDKIVLQEGDSVVVPPDLEYSPSGLVLAKDLSQILFQVAAAAGTIAVLSK